jgi:transketolase
MPSWELFRKQSASYKKKVLPDGVTARVSIEAAATFGWKEWVVDRGVAIGLDHFGASAPYEDIFQKYEITSDRMAEEAKNLLD